MPKKKQKKTKRIIFYISIVLLSLLGIFQAGIVGESIYYIFNFIFGDFGTLMLIYVIILMIILLLEKKDEGMKSKYIRAINLSLLAIFLMYGKQYYLNQINVLPSISEFIIILRDLSTSNGSGFLGHILITLIYTLIGVQGLTITIIIIWVLVVLILFDVNKMLDKVKVKYTNYKIKKEEKKKIKDEEEKQKEEEKKQKDEEKDIKYYEEKYPLEEENNEETKEVNDELNEEVNDELNEEVNEGQEENQDNDNNVPIFVLKQEEKNEDYEEVITKVNDIDYQIPSIKILKEYTGGEESIQELTKIAKEKAEVLRITLESFKLNVKVSNIHIGPNVTKYELQPEVGVKVSKFSGISNDIALALAAKAVRIEAPIPGKSAVGIEIPNDKAMMVGLREVLESKNNKFDSKIQIGLGKDISGEAIFTEINKTPHLLVAGSTGSGKSVCINSLIISILTKATPDEVKLIMIDPKKVELTPYNGIPHLLAPVVTEPKKAAVILKKMVAEMEYRYELFAETNTRNIEGYNDKVSKGTTYTKLPYIVVIIDELADLMMVASNEVESAIARLAQMARAAGIHLIIATQRPSTDVITGLIKSNIPSRIAFAVSSSIDSRTILDSTGAEKLLGQGDMLYSESGSQNFTRIQGAYLADEEITGIVDFIIKQFPKDSEISNYDEELVNVIEKEESDEELDELYEEIKRDVIEKQKASTSYIQRKYKVGYNRAMRIMDQLEETGVISASEGTKPRKVLMEDDYED